MKSSSPKFMYHVAPEAARQSIEMHGLHPRFDQTGYDAIYLSVEPLGAEYDTDTWKVYVAGLDLQEDLSTPGFEGDWYMTTEPIPADRMHLLERGAEVDELGDVYAAYEIPQSVYDMAVYKHMCPMCGSYLRDRGGIFTCEHCPFEYDTNTQDFGGKEAVAQEDWEGPGDEPKNNFQPGEQVEYLWSNRPMFGYIMDGPLNYGEDDDPRWMWRVRFETGESVVRDSYLIPAQQHSLHEDEDLQLPSVEDTSELWPDTFPTHWGGVIDYGDHWGERTGTAFVYDPENDDLYLGRNHMAILYKIKTDDRERRYGPGFGDIIRNWDEWAQPTYVMGWIETDRINVHSDIGYAAGINPPTDEQVQQAANAINQHFKTNLPVENRQPDPIPVKTPPTSGIIRSTVDTSTLQSMLSSDEAASAAYDALTQAGGQVYIVGGAVRDASLGNNPKDIDLMCTGLTGDQIAEALSAVGRMDLTGKAFGVYRLRKGASEVEVAMPRTEQSTGAAHTDFTVNADPNIPVETDLGRRDFTVNAMAYDPATDEVIDPYGGQAHAQAGQLSLVNDQAFADDPLRIARALVAVSKHQLTPDENLKRSMEEHAPSLRNLPGERIQMEMDKLLSGKDPASAIRLAYETGVMPYLAPELTAMEGFNQMNPHHDLTVDEHTLAVLEHMTKITNDPDLRLAALFHDSGKPDSFWRDENAPEGGGGHFYKKQVERQNTPGSPWYNPTPLPGAKNPPQVVDTFVGQDHEDVGAANVREFMSRNRYPNARQDRVEKLVQMHMFPYFKNEKSARKFLAQAGDPKTAWDLLKLREADSSGKNSKTENEFDKVAREKSEEMLRAVIEKEQAVSVRDLAVNGHDLMQAGLKGPEIGRVQKALLEKVIEDPELNNKQTLLEMIPSLAS